MAREVGKEVHAQEVRLEELTQRPGVVLLSWWSPSSPAAVAFAAEYATAAASTENAIFTAINIGDHEELAESYGVRDVPTVMAFRDGVLVFRQSGFLPAAAVRQIVEAAQSADISMLRQAWNGVKGVTTEDGPSASKNRPPPAHPAPKR
jgi:thioredoxin 1